MAKRVINTSLAMTQFDGKPFVKDPSKDASGENSFLLKDALITYIRAAQAMGLNDEELNSAYTIGILLSTEKGDSVTLTTEQYRVLEKIVTNGKIKSSNGSEDYVFGLELRIPVRKAVEDAELIKE